MSLSLKGCKELSEIYILVGFFLLLLYIILEI